MKKVAIVGAGITGLTCAIYLQRAGLEVVVFEAADRVGGRVATEMVEGYKLDVGFQVFLESYEELRMLLDLEALQLGYFYSGATIYTPQGQALGLGNPLMAGPSALLEALGPWATVADKLRLAKLYLAHAAGAKPFPLKGISAQELLKQCGFTDKAFERLFRPFFGDVFLDRGLETDAGLFLYLFRRFAHTRASLPEGGMAAIPAQLHSLLKPGTVRLGSSVEAVAELAHRYDYVVQTFASPDAVRWNPTVNLYLCGRVERTPGNRLLLNAGSGPVRNVSLLSAVQPSYAPAGQDLVSVSLDASQLHQSDRQVAEAALRQILPWLGPGSDLRLLTRYNVAKALPKVVSQAQEPFVVKDGVLHAGDWLAYGSLNGAAFSGRRVAEQIIAKV